MILTLNGVQYDVQTEPLELKAVEAIQAMIGNKDGHPVLYQLVKTACQYAMGQLGIEKKDRNDSPIELVAVSIVHSIFEGINKEGITMTGHLVESAAALDLSSKYPPELLEEGPLAIGD